MADYKLTKNNTSPSRIVTGWRCTIMEQSIVSLPHLMFGADVGDGALDAHFVAATLERIFA